jgi:hypothetical protein
VGFPPLTKGRGFSPKIVMKKDGDHLIKGGTIFSLDGYYFLNTSGSMINLGLEGRQILHRTP